MRSTTTESRRETGRETRTLNQACALARREQSLATSSTRESAVSLLTFLPLVSALRSFRPRFFFFPFCRNRLLFCAPQVRDGLGKLPSCLRRYCQTSRKVGQESRPYIRMITWRDRASASRSLPWFFSTRKLFRPFFHASARSRRVRGSA